MANEEDSEGLKDDALKILRFIASNLRSFQSIEIALRLEMTPARAQHYWDEMLDADLIARVQFYTDEEMISWVYVWEITRKGRAYLVGRNLI
jgi:hypothetical protein